MCIFGELCSLGRERLVVREVLSVEQRDREVQVDPHPVARVPPDQVDPEGLVASGERNRPLLVSVAGTQRVTVFFVHEILIIPRIVLILTLMPAFAQCRQI